MLLNMVFNYKQQKLIQKKMCKKFIFTTKTNQWTECSKLKEDVCQKNILGSPVGSGLV